MATFDRLSVGHRRKGQIMEINHNVYTHGMGAIVEGQMAETFLFGSLIVIAVVIVLAVIAYIFA